jgi:hypothetical protein
MLSVPLVITPPLLMLRTSVELSTNVEVPVTLNPVAVMVSVGILVAEPSVSEAMLAADIGELQVTVKVPALTMDAFVPSPGTTAGDQPAAVFQSPLEAAAQEVCARLDSQTPTIIASKTICAGLYPLITINRILCEWLAK